ncbi:acyl carrier protein [Thermodesulfobacteriota bacterium]
MKEKVFKVVSQVMGVPIGELNDDSSPDTIEAWDSIKHMNLILALEEEFAVEFGEEDIVEMLNIQLIVETIKERLS